MRARSLIAAVSVAGVWVGACSKPTRENRQSLDPGTAGAHREIQLLDAPAPAVALVSDLEAGRLLQPSLFGRVDRTHTHPQSALTPARARRPDARATVAAALTPQISRTTSSTLVGSQVLATAPMPVASRSAAPSSMRGTSWRTGEWGGSGATDDQPDAGRARGPVIIIRGGQGGPDDRCDLHRRGGGGVGPSVAVNRLVPPRSIAPRGGIR